MGIYQKQNLRLNIFKINPQGELKLQIFTKIISQPSFACRLRRKLCYNIILTFLVASSFKGRNCCCTIGEVPDKSNTLCQMRKRYPQAQGKVTCNYSCAQEGCGIFRKVGNVFKNDYFLSPIACCMVSYVKHRWNCVQ